MQIPDSNAPDALHGRPETVPSQLARLQQLLVFTALAAAGVIAAVLLPEHPGWTAVVLLLLFGGHAAVLGLEFVLAAYVNRHDSVPRATALQWLGAWWQEIRVAPVVFAWRQPFWWWRCPDDTGQVTETVAPVVLVHGFVCNRGLWTPWMKALRSAGIPYVSVNLEPVFGSIDRYAAVIEAAVRRAERLGGRPPVMVGHSMGGLAIRTWLAEHEGTRRVSAVVTIGSPHRGTWLARFSHVTNGRQMQPGGDWLAELERRENAAGPAPYARFVCWYSNADNIVFPASTATLPGADNRLLPGAAHVALAYEPDVLASVKALALARPT